MEQIIRSLPTGTSPACACLAQRAVDGGRGAHPHHRHFGERALTLVDLLAADESVDIEFDPERLRLTARVPAL